MSELTVGSLSGLAANSYVIDVASGSSLDLSSGAILPAGSVVTVVSTTKTDRFSASLSSMNSTAITGLSLTHETADVANKLLISVNVGAIYNTATVSPTGIAVYDGTNFLSVGDDASGFARVTSGMGGSGLTTASLSLNIVHTPGAGSKTYSVYVWNLRGDTRTVQVNYSVDSITGEMNAASTMQIMEIAG